MFCVPYSINARCVRNSLSKLTCLFLCKAEVYFALLCSLQGINFIWIIYMLNMLKKIFLVLLLLFFKVFNSRNFSRKVAFHGHISRYGTSLGKQKLITYLHGRALWFSQTAPQGLWFYVWNFSITPVLSETVCLLCKN